MNIPKIVHIAWNDKNVIHNQSPIILNGLRNLIDLNPDWNVIVHDDNDIDTYLRSMLESSDYRLIEDKHIVVKSDVWRLIKLYTVGGLYVDIDRFCNISLSEIVDEKTMWVLPTCLDGDFSQDFMMSAPNNPVFLKTLQLIFHRRKTGYDNTYFLGPQTYMHTVTELLMGNMINSNPGAEVFAEIRKVISELPFIKTYREYPPYDTIIYKHDENKPRNWEELKRKFYADSKIKHWTGEW